MNGGFGEAGEDRSQVFAHDRGECVMGITLGVSDLAKAHAMIEKSTKRTVLVYKGFYGSSILVPANWRVAYGLRWFKSRLLHTACPPIADSLFLSFLFEQGPVTCFSENGSRLR